jgi:hypothetical protein
MGLVLAVAGGARAAPERPAPDGYARAHYDLLLVENCGLLTAEVRRGFELARDDGLRDRPLDEAAARAARIEASLAFEREWHNRGLGGSRPWCRQEGKAAALAFFARFIDDRFALPAARP